MADYHLLSKEKSCHRTDGRGFSRKAGLRQGLPNWPAFLTSLWHAFWPTLGHGSGIHVAQVGRARGYSTGTGTLVTVPFRESEVVKCAESQRATIL